MEDVKESFIPAPPGWVQISKDKQGSVWADPVVALRVKPDGNCQPIIAEANDEGQGLMRFTFGGGPKSRGVMREADALLFLSNCIG